MDRRLALDDQAASQILGFIVGLTVVTASLAIATYFIVTVPESGADEQSQKLQGGTHRAAETLTQTPGQPANWDENFDKDKLRRVGLLEPGTDSYADRHKIEKIQDGNLTGTDILDSWDLNATDTAVRIEGRVQSVPLGETPTVDTYGVVASNVSKTDLGTEIPSHSEDAAELYAKTNDGYTYEKHNWKFAAQTHPDTGLGTTVPDHAWFVETQLIPKLAGIEATHSTADHGNGEWEDARASVDAFNNYTGEFNGGPDSATRWHVVADGEPWGLPGNPPSEVEDHALAINWHKQNGGSDANGVGLWRTAQGDRSTALLGGFDAGDADHATLSFRHHLRVNTDDLDLCETVDDTDCDMVRPSILFWNTTADRWSRIAQNASGCPASGWNDTADSMEATWGTDSIDLCEALDNSDDKLWLSLMWDSDCFGPSGGNQTCSNDNVAQGWFVDNIELTADGTTVYETGFEPPEDSSGQALFVSNGVDHNRTYEPGPDKSEENTVAYLRNMVQDGGNIVALSPEDAQPGDWLSPMGLSSIGTAPDQDVSTDEPGSIVLRYPNELPQDAPDYVRENVTWLAGTPNVPYSDYTAPDENLTVVQSGPDGNATLLQGTPFPGGGQVAALSYNYTHFDNSSLRADLWENLHGSSVFVHPTFTVGDELPEPGRSEVASAQRVMLVEATPDGRYVVPLETTVWMWNRG